MDSLPDFSKSKMEIRNRIEGALRVKRKRTPIYQYTLFMGLFLFTTICSALYFKNIFLFNMKSDSNQLDYNDIERLLMSEQLESESIIKLPSNLSLLSASEAIIMSDASPEIYE